LENSAVGIKPEPSDKAWYN